MKLERSIWIATLAFLLTSLVIGSALMIDAKWGSDLAGGKRTASQSPKSHQDSGTWTPPWTDRSAADSSPTTISGAGGASVGGGSTSFGTIAKATYRVEKEALSMEPNNLGVYPQVVVGKKQLIPISIKFNKGSPGDPIAIQVQDGGGLSKNSPSQVTKLDDQLAINFNFTSGSEEGIYRVSVFNGNEFQTLSFWVGALPPVRPLAVK